MVWLNQPVSRARDLFIRLRDGGCAALDALIAERELESLFLDFKRSPADGAAVHFAPDDNKNLAKAVSGFSNSSGGVLVWGVDCRKDPATAKEVAEKRPLVDAAGFATKVQNAISRVTLPPHTSVEVAFFDEPSASPTGYVAVLIPQSVVGPLRSVVSNHYHLRSGSDFGIVPHDVLAGMFGRAPQPEVDINVVSYRARLDGRPGCFTLALGLFAVNLGAVVAERPYISVAYFDTPYEFLAVQCPDSENFSVLRGPLPVFSAIANSGVVLPPGSSAHVCDIVLDTPLEQPRSIKLDCTLGVLGAPPKRFSFVASEAMVRDGMNRVKKSALQTTEVLQLNPRAEQ